MQWPAEHHLTNTAIAHRLNYVIYSIYPNGSLQKSNDAMYRNVLLEVTGRGLLWVTVCNFKLLKEINKPGFLLCLPILRTSYWQRRDRILGHHDELP
jgi:hypothetical protein